MGIVPQSWRSKWKSLNPKALNPKTLDPFKGLCRDDIEILVQQWRSKLKSTWKMKWNLG